MNQETSFSISDVSLLVPTIVISILLGCAGYYWTYIYHPKWIKQQVRRLSDDGCTKVVRRESKKHKERKEKKDKEEKPCEKLIETHPLYANSITGLTRETTCVAINVKGTKVVVSSSDSSIRVYSIDPNKVEGKHSYIKCVLNSDYCTAVDLAVNDDYVFGATELTCKLVKFSVTDNQLKFIGESAKAIHKESVRWLSSSKGRWIVTSSLENDTEIKVFNYSLDLIASVDSKQIKNFQLAVSPIDGRFFGVAAWSPGMKVMEVITQKEGNEIKKCEKAMDLPSTCGLSAAAINNDNTRAVVACKDGSMVLWNINIRYEASEDPKTVASIKEDFTDEFKGYSQLHFTHDSSMIIGSSNSMIRIFKTEDLSLIQIIHDCHPKPIHSLAVNPTGNFFITAAADAKPRIWRLPTS